MSSSSNSLTKWLESLGRNQNPVTAVLTIPAVIAILVSLVILRNESYDAYRATKYFILAWGFLVSIVGGVWNQLRDRENISDVDAGRALVLGVGGAIGVGLYTLAFFLIYSWWDTVGGGLEEWQGEKGWRIWVIALVGLGGLAVTFASLLVGRTEEQSNPLLRRLLYGYNAVLAGQLVLLILIVINILGYIYLPRDTDWTRNRLFTLSSLSQNILKNLEKPLKVYVIVDSRDDWLYQNIDRLLENCRAINPKVQVELVLRGRQSARVQELMRRYLLIDPLGLLVVSGGEAKEDSQFIKAQDLIERPPMDFRNPRQPPQEPIFKGEQELMTAIRYLEEGKARPVVYFLQGHDELDVSRSIEPGRPQRKAEQLRSMLEKGNYQVKSLRLSPVGNDKPEEGTEVVAGKVPDDASVVVVAGARTRLEDTTLAALREYMNPKEASKKKGTMLVLLDVVVGPDKQMVRTGLEAFVQEFNVEVGNDRILSTDPNNPEVVIAIPNPAGGRNELVQGLGDMDLPFIDVRTVKARTSGPPQGPGASYAPDVLLTTAGRLVWAETNLDNPVKIIEELIRTRYKGLRERLAARLSLAVTVSESTGAMPGDPHAGMMGGASKPRMVVFGNALWASDKPLPSMYRQSEDANAAYYSLFASSLAWLREKPGAIGEIKPKQRDLYQMSETTNVSRLLLLPAGLIFVTIIGLGLGVWVVRRR